MRFIFVILLLMFVFDGLWWWLADRRVRSLPRARVWRAGAALFAVAQIVGMALLLSNRILSSRPGEILPQSVLAAIYIWHFVVLPASVVLIGGTGLVRSLIHRLAQLLRRPDPSSIEMPVAPTTSQSRERNDSSRRTGLTGQSSGTSSIDAAAAVPTPSLDAPRLSRRQLLGAAVAAAPPLVLGVGTYRAMSSVGDFQINRVTVALRSLPAELDGLTIAHVSDTHVGSFTNGKVLDRIVEQTNGLKSDLVLLTGDLINHNLADLPAAIDMVGRMRASLGVYLCEGNHDLLQDRSIFGRKMREANLNLLVNESAFVSAGQQEIQLLGLRWGGRLPFATRMTDPNNRAVTGPVQTVTPQLRPGAFPILLAHHPHAFDSAADAGIPLTLAGHTHGGQLMATRDIGFGPLMFRYWSGLYRHQTPTGDDAALFVSNGVGNWFPLRINAPAEIVHITLTRG